MKKLSELTSGVGGVIAVIYFIPLGFADLYFAYKWVDDGGSVIVNIITLVFYGWIWTTIQAFGWPLYVLGIL